jgi:hypothetical protein
VNADSTILPSDTLEFTAFDTDGQLSKALGGAVSLLDDPEMIGLVGTAYTRSLEPSAIYASQMTKPIISPGSQSPEFVNKDPDVLLRGKPGIPYLMRTIESQGGSIRGMVAAIKEFGWANVGLLGTRDQFGDAVFDLFQEEATTHGINIVDYVSAATGETANQLTQKLRALRENTRVNVLVVLSVTTTLVEVLTAIKAAGFLRGGGSGSAVIVRALRGYESYALAGDATSAAGLLYVDTVPRLDTAARASFDAGWAGWTTWYNETEFGEVNSSNMHATLYDDSSNTIWDYGPVGPDRWGTYLCEWRSVCPANRLLAPLDTPPLPPLTVAESPHPPRLVPRLSRRHSLAVCAGSRRSDPRRWRSKQRLCAPRGAQRSRFRGYHRPAAARFGPGSIRRVGLA